MCLCVLPGLLLGLSWRGCGTIANGEGTHYVLYQLEHRNNGNGQYVLHVKNGGRNGGSFFYELQSRE